MKVSRDYSSVILLTVKFGTSFVVTRRKVCELHPVSRHVGSSPLLLGCPACSGFVSKYPVTSDRRGEPVSRCARSVGIRQRRAARRRGASVIGFASAPLWLCADCVPVLRVKQRPVRDHLPCAPEPDTLWSMRDAPEQGGGSLSLPLL